MLMDVGQWLRRFALVDIDTSNQAWALRTSAIVLRSWLQPAGEGNKAIGRRALWTPSCVTPPTNPQGATRRRRQFPHPHRLRLSLCAIRLIPWSSALRFSPITSLETPTQDPLFRATIWIVALRSVQAHRQASRAGNRDSVDH